MAGAAQKQRPVGAGPVRVDASARQRLVAWPCTQRRLLKDEVEIRYDARSLRTSSKRPSIVTLARQDRDSTPGEEAPMSSLDLELDSRMDDLELEWREAREASIIARAEYLALGANPKINAALITRARDRLRSAEAREARTYSKIELLENNMLGLS